MQKNKFLNIFGREKRKNFLYVRDIIDKLLLDEDIDLFVNPISGECFILKKDKSICIRIGDDKVDLLNQNFCVNKDMTLKFCEGLKTKVKIVIGEKIDKIKKELFFNQIDLLRKIYNYNK